MTQNQYLYNHNHNQWNNLYFSLLLETKDLLNATTSLLEEYHTAYDSSVKPATVSEENE